MDDNHCIYYLLTTAVVVNLDDGADGLEDWCDFIDGSLVVRVRSPCY